MTATRKDKRRQPSLAEQGRRLTEIKQRILDIHDQADAQLRSDPKHADAWREQARLEAAPLIAEGAALRDAILLRARRRARLAWGVAYTGIALVVVVLLAWLIL